MTNTLQPQIVVRPHTGIAPSCRVLMRDVTRLGLYFRSSCACEHWSVDVWHGSARSHERVSTEREARDHILRSHGLVVDTVLGEGIDLAAPWPGPSS